MKKKNLIQTIYDLMSTDDEDWEDQSKMLKSYYEHCTKNEKEAVNACFIALCGYSLETLLCPHEHTEQSSFGEQCLDCGFTQERE